MMTISTTKKNNEGQTEEFEVNKRVKQGDALSTTLLNLVLQPVPRNSDTQNRTETDNIA